MKKGSEAFLPAFFVVAFVWFTTHFGGGFASGRQLVEFFVQYGWYALFTPILAMAINGIIFYYVWDFSRIHETYQYRSWADAFYRPYQGIFSNLYEVLYNIILFLATAVAFATGGETIKSVLGTPYLLNTLFIAVMMFLLTIYGADVVRAAASFIAIAVISGLLLIYGTNLVAAIPRLVEVLKSAPAPKGFGFSLWQAIKYASLQTAVVGGYVAVTDVLKTRQDVKKAAIWGFIMNAGILLLASAVSLSYYPQVLTETVPVFYVIRNGFGGRILELLVSLLIFLGVVSTGVNLIYGGAKRLVSLLSKKKGGEAEKGERFQYIIASGVYVLVAWSIALLGLIPLVAKGYSYVGYLAIPIVVLPVLWKGIRKKDWEKV